MAKDNLGREIPSDFGSNMAEIKAMIKTLMNSKTGEKRKVDNGSKDPDTSKLKNIIKDLEKLGVNIKKEMRAAADYLVAAVGMATKGNSKRTAKAVSDKNSASLTTIEDDIANLAKHALKKGSIYTHDVGMHKLMGQLLKEVYKINPVDVSKHRPSDKDASSASTSSNNKKTNWSGPEVQQLTEVFKRNNPDMQDSEITELVDNMMRAKDTFNSVSKSAMKVLENATDTVQRTLFGLGKDGDLGQTFFGGIVDKEIEFIKNSRAAAYEVAGITSETKGLQKEFSALDKSAYLTGMSRNDMQEQYLKNVKSGIKDQKMAKAITVAQLQVEKQLGLEAGAFGETFQEFTNAGRMGADQISDMANGMKSAARNAGVSGEKLKAAVSSAKSITDMMIKSATLTSASVKNITAVLASAEKFGVGDKAKELLTAASSSASLLFEGSEQTKNLLYNAAASVGKVGDLQKGILTRSKAGIKDLRMGLDNVLKSFGVQGADAIDNLSDEAKMNLNIQLKAAFGVELGELRNQIDALAEQENGLAGKMVKLNAERMKNLTIEEKIALAEDERRAKVEASFGALTALGEAAKGAKDMNQALEKFGKRKNEFEDDIKALGGDFKTSASAAKTALTSAIENVNEGLKKAGKAELDINSKEISKALQDPVALREVTAKITKGNQELETAQKAALDPMSSVEQSFKEYNDMFRSYSSSALAGITDLVGNTGMMAIGITTISVSKLAELGRTFQTIGPELAKIGGYFSQSMKSGTGGIKGTARSLRDTLLTTIKGVFDYDNMAKSFGAGQIEYAAEAAKKTGTRSETSDVEKTLENAANRSSGGNDFGEGVNKVALVAIGSDAIKSLSEIVASKSTSSGSSSSSAQAEARGADTSGLSQDESLFDKASKILKKYGKSLAGAALGLLALGMALIFAIKTLSWLNLDLGKFVELAVIIAGVIGGAIAIAKAIEEGMPILIKLGDVFDSARSKENAERLMKGAAFLLVMAPVIAALSISLLYLLNLVSRFTGIDFNKAVEVGWTIAAAIGALAAISVAVGGAVAAMAGLGYLAEMIEPALPHILAGAAVLFLVAPVIAMLSLSILGLIKSVGESSGIDFDKAIEVGFNVAAAIGALVAISFAMVGAISSLSILGTFAALSWGAIGLMTLGAVALMAFIPTIKYLMSTIGSLVSTINTVNPEDIKRAAEGLDGVAKLLPLLSEAINGISEHIEPLVTKRFWIFGSTPLDDLEGTISSIGGRLAGVFKFIDEAVITPIFKNIGNPRDVKIAAEAMEGVSKLLPLIPEVINGLAENIKPLVTKSWWFWASPLDKVDSLISAVGGKLGNVFKFVDEAIITPIFENIGNPRDVKIAAEAMEGVSKILPLIPEVVNGLAENIKPLITRSWWFWASPLEKVDALISDIGTKLAGVFKFIDEAVINPIFDNIGNPRDVKIAAEAMEGVAKMLPNVQAAVEGIGKHLQPLMTKGWFSGSTLDNIDKVTSEIGPKLAGIFKFVDEAIITPIFENIGNPNDAKIATEALINTNKLLEIMPAEIRKLAVNLNPLSAALKSMTNIDLPSVEAVVDIMGRFGAVSQMLTMLPEIIGNINTGMGSISAVNISFNADEVSQKMNDFINGIAGFVSKGINPQNIRVVSTQVGEAAKDLVVLDENFKNLVMSLESISNSMNKVGALGANLSGLDMGNISASLSGILAGKPSMQVSTAPIGATNPASVQQKLEMERVSTQSSTNITSSDLSALNETATKDLEINEQIRDLLKGILSALTVKSQGSENTSTTPASTRTKAGNTFNLATGRFSESSAVGVTNLGK